MRPDIWGPPAWFFLHSVTLDYPESPTEQDKNNITNFFTYLGFALPCHKCRVNYSDHIKAHPITPEVVSSRKNLVMWLIDIHNDINKMNGKAIFTYDEAVNNIMEAYSEQPSYSIFIIIIVIIILILIILFIYINFFCD